MSNDIFPEDEVDDLVSQLKDNNTAFNKAKRDKVEVNADNLEEFIMKSSGELVQDSLEMISNIKEFTNLAPDARETESLAELMKASSTAIETLNKILLQNKKSDTQVKVKEMDVNARRGIAIAEQQTKILLSREEIMSKLIKDAEILEVDDEIKELPESSGDS